MSPDPTSFTFAAVLTGDIIASRRHEDVEIDIAMQVLAAAAADIATDTKTPVIFERHRGDGWQVFLPQGNTALRAALRLVARLRAHGGGIETRAGIGLGDVRLSRTADLASAGGRAFVHAADALRDLPRASRMGLGHQLGDGMSALLGLIDWQSQHWTPPQAEALYEALGSNPPTQKEIAALFGISRQAVGLRLGGTALEPLQQAITHFETAAQGLYQEAQP